MFAFFQFAYAPEGLASATARDYQTFLEEIFGSFAPLVEHHSPLSTFNLTQIPVFFAVSEVISAYSYNCPAHRGLNTAAKKGLPAWTSLFAHTSKCS